MEKKTFYKFSIFFAAVYLFSVNGLGKLSDLSLNFLLKENIKLTASQAAYFQAVMFISWVIKPLWGYISDAFPLFGYRRKSYLILMALITSAAWFGLAGISTYTVFGLLFLMTITSLAYAFQDVATDGLMVEVGQPENLTGRFQSFQWTAVYLGMIITSFAGGALADLAREGKISYQMIFAISGIFPFITALLAWKLVPEQKVDPAAVHEKVNLRAVFGDKEIWRLAFFMFLWTFSPSFGAPFFYYAVDTLKFSGAFMGQLQALGAVAALIAVAAAGKWIDRIPVRKFLIFTVFAGVSLILLHLVYFSPWLVARLEFARLFTLILRAPLAAFEALVALVIMNLAARISPRYAGGSVFALLMSFYNLGQLGSSVVGGLLFSKIGLPPLMLVSALFSLFALLILPYLAIPEPLTRFEAKTRSFLSVFSVKK